MSNKELRICLETYLQLQGLERELYFSRHIYPFFRLTINNVLASLNIKQYERADYNDLKQDAHLKLLEVICNDERLEKTHNIRSYCFIIVRNVILDTVRKQNSYNKYFELCGDFWVDDDSDE